MRILGLCQHSVRRISTAPKVLNAKFLLGLYESSQFRILPDSDVSNNDINSTRSLPMVEFPKSRIFDEVMRDGKVGNWRKPMTKWYRLGISLLKYYRDGIKNTYVVFRDSRKIMKNNKLPNDTELLSQLFRTIEAYELQMKRTKNTDISISLPRSHFAEIIRRKEMWKLPNFFLICLIFEEMTALVCYFLPQLAPRNCLTPGGFKKISNSKIKQFEKACQNLEKDTDYISPYSLTNAQLFDILKSSPLPVSLTSIFIHKIFNNQSKLVSQVNDWHKYLLIDDWLLLNKLIREQKLDLHKREFVNCIYERRLYKQGEDLNSIALTKGGERILIERLVNYWRKRFDNTIVLNGENLFSEKWGTLNMKSFLDPVK